MSLFDYPRINFKGTIQLNPGTANNDDYAQQPSAVLPASFGPYAGQVLGLIDSKTVRARTYGMSDADFIAWVQKAHTFDVAGSPGKQTSPIIPAEWNYYGGMESKILSATVIGVQTGPSQRLPRGEPGPSRDRRDRREPELLRSYHRRQFGGFAAGDPVLHRPAEAPEGHRAIPGRQPLEGSLPVAEFLSKRQSHGRRRGRRLRLPRHEEGRRRYNHPGSGLRRSEGRGRDPSLLPLPTLRGGLQQRRDRGALPEEDEQSRDPGDHRHLRASVRRRTDRHRSRGPAAGLQHRADPHAAEFQQQRQRLHRPRSGGPAAGGRHRLRRFLRHVPR